MNDKEMKQSDAENLLEAKPRNKKEEERRQHSVYVGELLPGISSSEIQQYFSKFGTIKKTFFLRKKRQAASAVVVFSTPDEVKAAVQFPSPHVIEGKEAKVDILKPRDNKTFQVPSTVAAGKVKMNFWNYGWNYIDPHRKLMDQLDRCTSVLSQIQAMCESTTLAASDISLRQSVLQDVREVLKQYYPSSGVDIHGSMAIGHGKPKSPFDMYFEPLPGYTEQFQEDENTKKLSQDLPDISELKAGTVSSDFLRKLPPESHAKLVKNIIEETNIFKKPHVARMCQYARFVHKKTGIECHLICCDRASLCSNRLLKFYSSYDSRFVPVMKILHYWARFRGIVHLWNMSSYCFSLLVVFFLQNTVPAILPALEHLQKIPLTAGKSSGKKWRFGFCDDISIVPKSANRHHSVDKLVSQFFEFYSTFDYSNKVCPLDGKLKAKPVPMDLESENERPSQNVGPVLCVENPFVSTKSKTADIEIPKTKYFVNAMKKASQCYQIGSAHTDAGWGLMRLFESHRDVYEVPTMHSTKSTDVISFALEISRKLQCHLTEDPMQFVNRASSILIQTFEAFLLEAEVIDMLEIVPAQVKVQPLQVKNRDSVSAASMKTNAAAIADNDEASSDILSSRFFSFASRNFRPVRLISIQSTVMRDTWSERKKCNRILKLAGMGEKVEGCSNILEMERAKSEAMSAAGHVKQLPAPTLFSCDCFLYRVEMCDRMVFMFTPHKGFNNFPKFGFLMKAFVERALDHLLLENKQLEDLEFYYRCENNGDSEAV